jgi:hypothetical protein
VEPLFSRSSSIEQLGGRFRRARFCSVCGAVEPPVPDGVVANAWPALRTSEAVRRRSQSRPSMTRWGSSWSGFSHPTQTMTAPSGRPPFKKQLRQSLNSVVLERRRHITARGSVLLIRRLLVLYRALTHGPVPSLSSCQTCSHSYSLTAATLVIWNELKIH